MDLSHGWLIHKAGRGWYRPNAKGYTGCLAEAGRYSRADALLYSHPNGLDGPRDNITIKHESEAATTRADLCASGQQVRALALLEAARFIETMEQVDPPEPMTAEMLKAVAGAGLRNMAKRLAPLTPAQQPAVEPVPVAYQVRMSDGRWGTIFHHPDKPLGDHRPLYAYPPQPSASVAEAGYNDVIHALIKQHETVMRSKGRNPIDYTTKWSLAADAVAALQALKGDDANG